MGEFWTEITTFLRGLSNTTRIITVVVFVFLGLFALRRFINKNVQKDKMKIGSLVIVAVCMVCVFLLFKYC